MKILSPRCLAEESDEYWSQTAKNVADFYNAPSTQYYREMEIDLFKTYFKDLKGKKLLKLDLWNEVNNTRILVWAAQQKAEVYGLDISSYIVNAAKKTFKDANLKANLIQSDMRDIKFPSNSFDFVYSMGTIEHVPDYNKAIKEIYRVLKPGGTAIIGVPNKWDPFLRPVMIWFLTLFNKYPYAPEKCFSFCELKKAIESSGLTVTDKSGILFMPGFLRIVDIFCYKKIKPLCKLTKAILWPFRRLESKKSFKKHGYLIAYVCKKPK